jgi:hypothetical protein
MNDKPVIPAKAGIQNIDWSPAFAGVTSLILLAGICLPIHADDLAENQARFGAVTGTVQILTQGADDWLDVQTGLPIDVGDEIRTDEDGEAELWVAENVVWVIAPGSDLIVGRTEGQEGHLQLCRGALRGKVETPTHRVGVWEFETPVAVCAVRGTEFALTHSEVDGTHLGVFKGVVAMRQAETATESFSPVMIGANEEGILVKRQPLRKLTSFTPVISAQARELPRLQRRFHEAGAVWTPLTRSYRLEMRRKLVPAPRVRKQLPRHAGPRRRGPR